MKFDEINKFTDAQLEEQKLYYENRKAGFKEYHDEYVTADYVLRDIEKEIEKRESMKDIGKCFKHKCKNKYICSLGIYFDGEEHECLVIEDSNNIYIDYLNWTYVTRNSSYEEISKEEFLNQYLTVVNNWLYGVDPNISMIFQKEVTND